MLFLGVAGLFLFRLGLAGMILGGAFVADGVDVTAQLDSEIRFLSAIALGVGFVAVWMFLRFEDDPRVPAMVSTFALLGGILRLVSIAQYGPPPIHAYVAIPIEFLVPLSVLFLITRRADGAPPAAAPARTGPFAPGRRKGWARRVLQVLFVGVAGLFLFRFGLVGMILGGRYVAGGGDVTALMDSETRFLSAIAFGCGFLALWLVRNIEQYPRVGVGLSIFALLGGFMRLVSIGLFGLPGTIAIIATALEFLVPIATIALIAQRERTEP